MKSNEFYILFNDFLTNFNDFLSNFQWFLSKFQWFLTNFNDFVHFFIDFSQNSEKGEQIYEQIVRYLFYDFGSTWSKPDLGHWGHTAVQLVIHVTRQLIVVLISKFIKSIGWVAPPSIQQETEEEWEQESGVEIWSVDIENTISFEWCCWALAESSCDWQITHSSNQTFIIRGLPWMLRGTSGSGTYTRPANLRMYSSLFSSISENSGPFLSSTMSKTGCLWLKSKGVPLILGSISLWWSWWWSGPPIITKYI